MVVDEDGRSGGGRATVEESEHGSVGGRGLTYQGLWLSLFEEFIVPCLLKDELLNYYGRIHTYQGWGNLKYKFVA